MQAPAGTGQNPASPTLGVGMSVELQCPECQSTLRVADENIGKRSKCPSCAHVFTVDGASGVASSDATRIDQRNQEVGNPLVDPLVDGESFTDGVTRDPVDWQTGSTPNPYSPISSQVTQTVELGPITPTVVTIDQVLEAAIALFRKHWVAVGLTVGIVAAVNYGVNFFYNILTAIIDNTPLAGEEWLIGINVVVFLLISILGLWLQLGQSLVMLDISRGHVADYGRIFAAASFLPSAIGAWLIRYSLLGLVVLAFAGIPSGLAYLMTGELETPIFVGLVGACLGAVPFFVLMLGFSMAQLLVLDQRCGPWDAVVTSWQITQGNKITLLLLGLVVSAISVIAFIVGVLALCVGLIFTMVGAAAFGFLAQVVAYMCMTGQPMVIPEVNAVRA